MTAPADLTPLAEAVECEFMHSYESQAPEPAYADLGIATARIGGGVARAMRNDRAGWSQEAPGSSSPPDPPARRPGAMRRAGLTPLYERRNWVWRAAS
jgi:hypothetical protein